MVIIGWEGFSGLISGHRLIAAAIGALSMLMSEPTAKRRCKEDTYVCPLTRDITLHLIYSDSTLAFNS